MIRMVLAIGLAAGVALTDAPARAQTAAADADDNHYSYNRVEDGYLRLDTRSGEVSLCHHVAVGWSCEVVPDDRLVLDTEIARLRSENASLKKALLDRGLSLPHGISANASMPNNGVENIKPPSDTNIERVQLLVGKMWRRLVDMIVNLQRDILRRT